MWLPRLLGPAACGRCVCSSSSSRRGGCSCWRRRAEHTGCSCSRSAGSAACRCRWERRGSRGATITRLTVAGTTTTGPAAACAHPWHRAGTDKERLLFQNLRWFKTFIPPACAPPGSFHNALLQARALMFMWAVSDGVLAAVAEMEAAARDLLAQPAAAAPASRAAPATSSTAAAAPELSGTAPLPHTGQAPLQQQQHHSSLAPALVRNPDALPPEGPLGRSAGDTTASGMRSMSGTSGSATVTAGHIAGVSSTVGTSSPSAQPPPALKGPALRLRRLRQAAVAQARAVGVWLEREFGWAWRVLQVRGYIKRGAVRNVPYQCRSRLPYCMYVLYIHPSAHP